MKSLPQLRLEGKEGEAHSRTQNGDPDKNNEPQRKDHPGITSLSYCCLRSLAQGEFWPALIRRKRRFRHLFPSKNQGIDLWSKSQPRW